MKKKRSKRRPLTPRERGLMGGRPRLSIEDKERRGTLRPARERARQPSDVVPLAPIPVNPRPGFLRKFDTMTPAGIADVLCATVGLRREHVESSELYRMAVEGSHRTLAALVADWDALHLHADRRGTPQGTCTWEWIEGGRLVLACKTCGDSRQLQEIAEADVLAALGDQDNEQDHR
jgi:hypothetical protein